MEVRPATVIVRLIHLLIFLLFCFNICFGDQREIAVDVKVSKQISFIKTDSITKQWKCLLYQPDDYRESEKPWPLMIYLHGRSLRGDDLKMVKRYGPPAFLDKRKDFPFVVCSPQLPAEEYWQPDTLIPLVDELLKRYKVDKDRVYLTGVSMGGGGVWNLASADQMKFAAMAPVCGYGEISIAEKLDDIPIWAFHGKIDRVTPLGPHQRLVDAVNAAGGEAKITVIEEGTHGNIIYPTYQRKELYDWLLAQDRVIRPEVKVREITQIQPELPNTLPFKNRGGPVKPEPPQEEIKSKKSDFNGGYVVKRGDTLWSISRANGISVDQLKQYNRLRSNVIQIGQELKIPQG